MNPQQAYEDAFFSRPQMYGGFGGFSRESKTFAGRGQRQRLNVTPIYQCLLGPWLLFCFVYAVMAFDVHYSQPWLSYALVGLPLLGVLGLVGAAVSSMLQKLKQDASREPSWFIFLALTMLIAWVLGVLFGDLNFWTNAQPYYDYINLNTYADVNPGTTLGQQLMDAGRVHFTADTTLEIRRSMGFKSLDTYCVAPITLVSNGTILPLSSYDFWAVGLDCCSSSMADFHCGEFNNPRAHGGLRLLRDDQRAFFRLAVQQAEAAYSIKATHPLFFYWVEDPTAEMASFQLQGYKYYLAGIMVHFAFQLFCVGLAMLAFAKIGMP